MISSRVLIAGAFAVPASRAADLRQSSVVRRRRLGGGAVVPKDSAPDGRPEETPACAVAAHVWRDLAALERRGRPHRLAAAAPGTPKILAHTAPWSVVVGVALVMLALSPQRAVAKVGFCGPSSRPCARLSVPLDRSG